MTDEPVAPIVETMLQLSGDFDPDEVTRATGLTPSWVRREGERGRTGRLMETNR